MIVKMNAMPSRIAFTIQPYFKLIQKLLYITRIQNSYLIYNLGYIFGSTQICKWCHSVEILNVQLSMEIILDISTIVAKNYPQLSHVSLLINL